LKIRCHTICSVLYSLFYMLTGVDTCMYIVLSNDLSMLTGVDTCMYIVLSNDLSMISKSVCKTC